uniref:Uncharacterized protein n=1 Tax=Aegilops tauschii TaxID=37682 RepID=N1R0C2_AEGTA
MCMRISRDSYPNLHALHNASNDSLTNAAYVKISEGDFGYVLDDVPHLADYLPGWSALEQIRHSDRRWPTSPSLSQARLPLILQTERWGLLCEQTTYKNRQCLYLSEQVLILV